ncbi:sodium:calcium antiporter [Geitlerinema sp. PCC 9228]|uniref:sodium:calcium antiporter n=1 Tax=Geitlerinema sp. PCC 9228 TaxID=111611 RepID=UPI001FCD45BE|nr:sodium:calcium antiporter [Geitlerinema sp. PCC 9228]
MTFDSLFLNLVVFVMAAIAIAAMGTKMAAVSDRLADSTGLGEAMVGGILLGGSTSLSGIVTSVTAATHNHPELASSNAIGGIAAQTAFLALADIGYRKANLEHAAASAANLMQGTLLVTLLSIPLLAMSGPQVHFLGIHPATVILVAAYIFGIRLVSQTKEDPMWMPRLTEQTRLDKPEAASTSQTSWWQLWGQFILLAAIVGVAGYAIAKTGIAIAAATGISESSMGSLFTGVATSLPELITTVAAVRQGALTLAVGGVIGGNSFDLLLLAFSDIGYRWGSIYGTLQMPQIFLIALTILMTGLLLLGLLRREKHGIGRIGFESFLVLMFYAGGVVVLGSSGF